ncbi:hypothetical protein [Clostridium perfringens]|uniref:Uncharacterized protein n=2 Tax=Clostridium perfringens TaxID=1502 RepID=A0A2X2XX62_CLOPF|nr:hypothetical protein [Clostridium perfringens]EDT23839.1 hypothetical protein AC1_0676 [Clostridium perfringens B str. ATCC 3626]ELC8331498.1 hypothetical protein [Clostridium perfringens]ELC8453537.1 hypothetical protein [Clostridium perfringens]NGU31888.1 hypothetical protein [Clostridium perfringens]WEV05974.1 hypothetical protein PL322_03095 [Clostridium perfringens B]
MPKKKSGYTISDKAKDYIREFKMTNNLPSQSQALEQILEEHKFLKRKSREEELELLASSLCKKIMNEFKGTKLGINNIDRNTQIMIEMLNGYYLKEMVGKIVTTTGETTEVARKSEALEIAEAEVKTRIHKAKIRKSYE